MFKYIILGSALSLATCAAIFSVTGFAQMFVGATFAAASAFTALEIAKLASVSFLYRYEDAPKLLRRYMMVGSIVLTIITSFGIYGYLSSAYAAGSSGIQSKENVIQLYNNQLNNVNQTIDRLSSRTSQLQLGRTQQENRLDLLISNGRSTTSQQRIIREQDKEIIDLQKQLTVLTTTKDSLSVQLTTTQNSISSTGKIGTLYYVAQTFGMSLDVIVKWFILLIVVVFDPMSISLFLAYNYIVKKSTNVTNVTETERLEDSNVTQESVILSEKAADFDPPEPPNTPPGESPTGTGSPVTLEDIDDYRHPLYDWSPGGKWIHNPAAIAWKKEVG
jgi:hypothetical protein